MNILLVQTSFLGDTILSTPVISGIKTIYPSANLWMMTTPESSHLVARDPLLTGVIPFDKRKTESGISGGVKMAHRLQEMNFEKVYALHRSPRTAILLKLSKIPNRIGFKDAKLSFLYTQTRMRSPKDHDVIRNLSILFGDAPLSAFDAEMRLFAPEKNEISPEIQHLLPPENKYVVLVPGSVWNTKRWSMEGYREIVKYFNQTVYKVVLSGSPAEKPLLGQLSEGLEVINIAGQATIPDAMYVVSHAKMVICNDSMALHMASAFKVPNVAVFCATSPDFGFSPWKNRSIIVERADLACKPCRRHGSTTCPTGTWECINGLPAEQVIAAIEKLM